MKKGKFLGSIGLLSAAALTLVACGKSNNNNNSNEGAKTASKFPEAVPKKEAKQGGTVKIALLSNSPFTGIFSNELYTVSTDYEVSGPGNESLFDTDDQFRFNDKGPATIKLDRKNKTVTIVVKKGVKWSDGKQVTAKDVEYPYEILANKGTKSQRYSSQLENIKGMKDYHEGKAKTISGIEMPDGENGRKVILHFTQLKPGMTNSGNDYFWESAEPYHYLKDVPFNKLMESDKVRKKPLYFGPYKLTKLVRGQAATWTPNKYYWRGKPKLDKIVFQVVSSNSSSQAIKSHKFDISSVVSSQWTQVKNTKGVNFVARIGLGYWYVGFKLGKFDSKTNKVVMNHKSKMNNKALRQAIAYAMNVDEVTKHYTHGISFHVPTLIPAQFGDYFNKDIKGYTYNLKKANQILDKAGYKKKGKWRVQPNGKPLKIKFLAMSGGATQEPIIQNYLQQWHKIGLNVSLVGGRLTEGNSFYDKVHNDDPAVDMFEAGWNLSSEPSPQGLYSEGSPFNYERFATPENTKLLEEMDSQKAFDHKYRVQKFHEWQKYMFDQAFVIPTTNSYSVTAVNKKLTNYSLKPSDSNTVYFKLGYVK
ncbi:Oligopeptide ABC transporter substrate binding protein [Lactobacillus helsingborgensis]|uniref:Oligopeptide ABC transporter substrate-binding protein n=1 Tax=Lactobacillus helsingborgensis TaxID=1218494 RepID=A0AA47GGB4_9LACO|nr:MULTISPECIES: oligopeptide ABC transporter substrate-binding protein [Lactobacillus]KJY65013.1 Oligopeptide ABC transporter substrate binding protein [Lactobacillus helsingborgensis]MBI0110865.1 oligopeptide ABC transporter substrate-binding protein [Lactobacillus sp. W8093]MCT6889738.1 oligopeptide ABC transporter substrate-binding protein [Lactobacillus sp.]UZX29018.1 oligopeptide ABC transporter substrate-binding protein [Lactobacillus helsingborgensis]